MFLIEGEDKALLIDVGDRREGLKQYIKTLTNKPVEVVITHGHGDHAGCIHEFETIYAPHRDIDMLNEWFDFDVSKCNVIDTDKLKEIDLGEINLEVIQLPGHTPGSIALLYREKEFLFTSDSIGSGGLWMQLPNCLSLAEYMETIIKLENMLNGFSKLKIFVGHPSGLGSFFRIEYLRDLIRLTDAIINGSVVGTPTENPNDFFGGYEAALGEITGLLYKKNNIHKKSS